MTIPLLEPMLSDFKKGTVAWLIQRYLEEVAANDQMKQIGASQMYLYRRLQQRSPAGSKQAAKLTKADIIAIARWLRQQKVKSTSRNVGPATVSQYLSCLGVVLDYAGSGVWDDCVELSSLPIKAARAFLVKHNLVGKSTPRDRRPSTEEIGTLEELGHQRNKNKRTRIDLVKLGRWQIASGRRLGESCRIEWRGWNELEQTMLVTKVKDPRRRNKNKYAALTDEAQFMLYELAWEMNAAGPKAWYDPQPRIFPWNAKSASQAYADLKRKAGIQNLRLHDSRGECASRLVESGYSPAQAILVTLHETTTVFERTYMRLRPENFRQMARRAPPQARWHAPSVATPCQQAT